MATAEQIKSLIRSHLDEGPEQFITAALQVAAHEAQQGHTALAKDIRALVDKARKNQSAAKVFSIPQDLNGLIISEQPTLPISSLVVSQDLKDRTERIILEYRQREKLKKHGMMHRRKILLSGPPGTGKTMTAKILAHELKQPLQIIQMDRLVTKFMGETSAKLRQIFDRIRISDGLYLFDEFDAIGGERSKDNDVGEMRRVLNSFLQFIENDPSENLIIAATNTPRLLDRALFRRFDDILFYTLPGPKERERLTANLLGTLKRKDFPLQKAANATAGLSHAEIDQACRDAIKLSILSNNNHISYNKFEKLIKEKQASYKFQKG